MSTHRPMVFSCPDNSFETITLNVADVSLVRCDWVEDRLIVRLIFSSGAEDYFTFPYNDAAEQFCDNVSRRMVSDSGCEPRVEYHGYVGPTGPTILTGTVHTCQRVHPDVEQHIKDDNKIKAIKAYLDSHKKPSGTSNVSVREAKRIVEDLIRDYANGEDLVDPLR